jgi:putative AdoMet-dependent methyltransferase
MFEEAFPAKDFDRWADSYDEDVVGGDQFPFSGYWQTLEMVVRAAGPRAGMTVLDLGIGTGNLARLFVEAGCKVWGTDYSPAMLAKAQKKLPGATLLLHDLRAPWPPKLERRFDRIVSAYTLHHFELDQKARLLAGMSRAQLEPGGHVVIADISFPSLPDMQAFAKASGDAWEQEPYWLADEAMAALKEAGLTCSYEQVSPCSGVYCIEPA